MSLSLEVKRMKRASTKLVLVLLAIDVIFGVSVFVLDLNWMSVLSYVAFGIVLLLVSLTYGYIAGLEKAKKILGVESE